MSESRKRLSDILQNSDREALAKTWSETQAADELKPIPAGDYNLLVLKGELFTSRHDKPGFKITLEVAEGELEGRRLWHDFYLSPAALKFSKRDLLKLGIEHLQQLDQPLPEGILLRGRVALRQDDSGADRNELRRFEVIGVEAPDPYTPDGSTAPAGDGNEPEGACADTSFDVETLERTPASEPAPKPKGGRKT